MTVRRITSQARDHDCSVAFEFCDFWRRPPDFESFKNRAERGYRRMRFVGARPVLKEIWFSELATLSVELQNYLNGKTNT